MEENMNNGTDDGRHDNDDDNDDGARNNELQGDVQQNGADEDTFNVGTVRSISIESEMRASYLDYAMSVIVARALPDARDGLKPVHRRILYAMHDMGLQPNTSYKKSARIVGEVLGKYHPHGDGAVYDAMARMAQDFSLRYPLVDGQGNFGSIDGDSPAAMRYTEARLAQIAVSMLQDIDQDTVDWGANFDDSLQRAIGPARHVAESAGQRDQRHCRRHGHQHSTAQSERNRQCHYVYVIDDWERRNEVGLEELMEFVKGHRISRPAASSWAPRVYARPLPRAAARFWCAPRPKSKRPTAGRFRIIVTEIPYQVNKTTLIERIAELARSGRLDQISDLRDESDRRGMRIVIELKRGAAPKKVRNQLFKHTSLQSSFGVNMLALDNGQPVTLESTPVADHLRRASTGSCLTRRTEFQLGKARERAHILEGLRIALEFLDEVIQTIRSSDSAEHAPHQSDGTLRPEPGPGPGDSWTCSCAGWPRWNASESRMNTAEVLARIEYLEDLLAHPSQDSCVDS